ncbi:MAG: aminotransferase class IV [Candidatus Sumerlaeia bacterium]|nr:aminotransferase class IV [Candidatus Sumerlaeia bacterium]
MPDIAYIQGKYIPLEEARLPLTDRACYFADAVYEVFATFGGKVFLFDEHMARLERSLQAVRIPFALDRQWMAERVAEGIRRCGYTETLIYLQISRGEALREKKSPTASPPTLFMTFRPKPQIPPDVRERGLSVLLVPDDRWARCNIKTIMLLPNILAHQKALDNGFDDAVFYDAQRNVLHEASSANLFLAAGNRLITPAEGPKILSGTVRSYVVRLARENGIAVEERDVEVGEILRADEAFLTGTTSEVLAVVRVNQTPLGDGRPGPLTRRLHGLFLESLKHL